MRTIFVTSMAAALCASAAVAQTPDFPDLDGDCQIGGGDLSVLLGLFGVPVEGANPADFTGDGAVTGADIAFILNAWGLRCEDVAGVNLRIFKGIHDTEVPEAKEETLGSFAVANLNDTDGDGTIDRDDNDTTATAAGRDDVDLMRLIIDKPPVDLGGAVTVTRGSGDVKFWTKPTKMTEVVFTGGMKSFALADLPATLWVEARAASGALRDIQIRAEYFGKTDTVQATAVWATIGAVEHDRATPAQLFAAGTPWTNITEPPKTLVQTIGGTGLIPETGNRLSYGILIRFNVQPAAVVGVMDGGSPVVLFDGTRQIDFQDWAAKAGAITSLGSKTSPTTDETPNDDTGIADKSPPSANANGHYFDYDAPSFPTVAPFSDNDFIISLNSFREFLRVRFDGVRPGGNAGGSDVLDGSRCSGKQTWHARMLFKKSPTTGRLVRSDGGGATETLANDVGVGTIATDQACAAEVGEASGVPGATVALPCTIFNLTNAQATFDWSVATPAGGPTLTPQPASGSITLAAMTAVSVPLNVKIESGSPTGVAEAITLTVKKGAQTCGVEVGSITVNAP